MDAKQKALLLILHKNGLWLQDTLSVLSGLRPCMRYSLDENTSRLVKKVLPLLGLKMILYTYKDINKDTCIIGKDSLTITKAYEADTFGDQVTLGKYLGYPTCCINFWEKNKSQSNFIALQTKQNSKSFDYTLNYIFNFDTRIRSGSLHFLKELSEKKYSQHGTYIIPYIPCSFDCTSSKKYTASLISLLGKEFPDYLQYITLHLRSVFLIVDNYKFLTFRGTFQQNELSYTDIIYSNTCLEKNIVMKILCGNKILWTKDTITILKNEKLLYEIVLRSEIIDFQ